MSARALLHRVDDLRDLPAPERDCRLVIGCCPEDVETWALAAEGLGLDVATVPTPGLREGLAFAWHARRPNPTRPPETR